MKNTQNKKEMAKPIYVVIRQDNETKEMEMLSLPRAIELLSSYWKVESIEEMLDKGQELFTPYATFSKEIIGFYSEPITIK